MRKIISFKTLVKILNSKYFASNIVLVTGCFDLLHSAHKAFLIAAKKKGDLLIVGLEPDKRIKFLKGKNRPVNCWQKRAENLARLEPVDFVFSLPESFSKLEFRLKLFRIIKVKVLAVSRNTPHLEQKKKLTAKLGVDIFIFPFDPRYSTSRLLTNC